MQQVEDRDRMLVYANIIGAREVEVLRWTGTKKMRSQEYMSKRMDVEFIHTLYRDEGEGGDWDSLAAPKLRQRWGFPDRDRRWKTVFEVSIWYSVSLASGSRGRKVMNSTASNLQEGTAWFDHRYQTWL